ncbi:MAG: hypothetical protein ABIY55_03895, partial [Kofleriaceae bacterium]
MPDPAGFLAVLGAFGVGPLVIYLRNRHRIEEKKLEIEARTGGAGGGKETKLLLEENKLLRERVENLESIVCNVDFELNQKLARMIDEQRSSVPAALPAAAPGTVTPNAAGVAVTVPAQAAAAPVAAGLDKTASAPAVKRTASAPLTTSLEPGQVLAQRYRVQRLLGKGGMGA